MSDYFQYMTIFQKITALFVVQKTKNTPKIHTKSVGTKDYT